MVHKPTRKNNSYMIKGRRYPQLIGTRAKVMHHTAYKTKAGLTAHDLKYNKSGKIVSRKKSFTAKRENRLKKYGYGYTKGVFGAKKLY